MDLLGSIMSTMSAPPAMSDKDKQLRKKHQELIEKQQNEEKEKLRHFRQMIEDRINDYLADPETLRLKLEPMDRIKRKIVHDVVEVAGLTAHSFGEEDVDRHIVVFKQEGVPSEDELECMKRGEIYDPIKAHELAVQREEERRALSLEEDETKRKGRSKKFIPKSGKTYQDKYEHIIGKTAALEAAKVTEAKSQYGFAEKGQRGTQLSSSSHALPSL
ncbi:unnamed protein product [Cyprideis torosa]|uniref:Uncharacterized protein n=1 Tax=Cyprideis torosa TaxID=163714 RepID=A0A7R8WFM3_9CRUS|nr:unnamed protein product [Cyprideis torosa]CAG0892021.1 unnamed protein product [Cyprideis torosa]